MHEASSHQLSMQKKINEAVLICKAPPHNKLPLRHLYTSATIIGHNESTSGRGERPCVVNALFLSEEDIVERPNGVFQWVVLVVPRIISQCRKGKNFTGDPSQDQETPWLPQEPRELYHRILEDIPDNERPCSLRSMWWICFALEPLSGRQMVSQCSLMQISRVIRSANIWTPKNMWRLMKICKAE